MEILLDARFLWDVVVKIGIDGNWLVQEWLTYKR